LTYALSLHDALPISLDGPVPNLALVTDQLAGLPDRAVRAARRFPWKLFLILVVIAVFGSAGVVFGLVRWLHHDLMTPQSLTAIQDRKSTRLNSSHVA